MSTREQNCRSGGVDRIDYAVGHVSLSTSTRERGSSPIRGGPFSITPHSGGPGLVLDLI